MIYSPNGKGRVTVPPPVVVGFWPPKKEIPECCQVLSDSRAGLLLGPTSFHLILKRFHGRSLRPKRYLNVAYSIFLSKIYFI